jgi:hypothetical protein
LVKTHYTLPVGRHDLSFTMNNVSTGLGFDYLIFVPPDSIDSVAYTTDIRSQDAIKNSLKYQWDGHSLQLKTLYPSGINSVALFTMQGRKVYEWNLDGKVGTVSIDKAQIPSNQLLLLIVKGRFGVQTIKIPILR